MKSQYTPFTVVGADNVTQCSEGVNTFAMDCIHAQF